MVTEIAPGVDLERDVLEQAEFPLRVAARLEADGRGACSRPSRLASRCRRADGGGSQRCHARRSRAASPSITLEPAGEAERARLPMLAALEAAARPRSRRTAGVRVAILTGAGPKAFCAGGDIVGLGRRSSPLDMWRRWIRDGHRVFDRLARLRQPLIAVLNGPALGGGLELAATADLRVAEEHARVGLPEAGSARCPAGRARSAWCAAPAGRR